MEVETPWELKGDVMLVLAGNAHEEVLKKRSVMRSRDECRGSISGGCGMGLLL